jgi:hypothetical protein
MLFEWATQEHLQICSYKKYTYDLDFSCFILYLEKLKNNTFLCLLFDFWWDEHCSDGFIKYILESLLSKR